MQTNLKSADNQFLHPWDDMNDLDRNERTFLVRGEGVYVYDDAGNRLMDAPAGMWCVNIGHGRREMADAISEQVMKLSYNSPWALTSEPPALLAAKLAELAPGDINHVFFSTGGSTAVDTALRFVCFRNNLLGRTDKKHFISRVNGYHGSTFLTASCSGKAKDKKFVDLNDQQFHYIGDPNPLHRKSGQSIEEFCDQLVEELRSTIETLGPDKVAAFVAEPILASGGVVVPPPDYLKRCAEVCRQNDVLVIADEVVTAFGRLGHFFSSEAVFDVVPDIITTAKGITSGYLPLGATLISDALLDSLDQTGHDHAIFANGYTYSGHPVACAAALKNIEIIEKENLLGHCREVAPYFQQKLSELASLAIVKDVRGMGLMACVECEDAVSESGEGVAEIIDRECQALGLIVRPIYNMCVMSPPLTITRAEIDELVEMLKAGIERAAKAVNFKSPVV